MASKDKSEAKAPPVAGDEDAAGPAVSVPDSADTGEGGKVKMIIALVKKCLGVKDIATMRLSLPASLLEPIPNLEYWHYLDRPDVFTAMNDSEDALDRMIAVLRFTTTKDLKFVHGKVCKPYNSVLGEHFRAHWDVRPPSYASTPDHPPIYHSHVIAGASPLKQETTLSAPPVASETASLKSTNSAVSSVSKGGKSPSTAATSPQGSNVSNLNLRDQDGNERVRVAYVTEQISHHPPVSAYFASCPARSIEMFGIDQISAKVSGTTVRVAPGEFNQGIFVKFTGGPGKGEQYRITHPVASVNGILRGSFYVTVGDTTIITCTSDKPGVKYRTIIEYKEESWLGKAHFLMEGVIFTVHDGDNSHEQWTKVKQVPKNRQAAVFEGTWRGKIRWRRVNPPAATSSVASSPSPSHVRLPTPSIRSVAASKADLTMRAADNDWVPLIDLAELQVIPKTVRPLEKQLPTESRKLWDSVTSRLLTKEYSEATREKVAIEQKQRDDAAERERQGIEFVPRYFEQDIDAGWAVLTEEGKKAIEEELREDAEYSIVGSADAQLAP